MRRDLLSSMVTTTRIDGAGYPLWAVLPGTMGQSNGYREEVR